EREGDGPWERLYPQDLPIRRDGTENAGHDNAREKENLDGISVCAQDEAPDQSGGEKAVVQALIGGQRCRGRGKFRSEAEGPKAARLVPEEHLQHEEINVEQGYQCNGDIRDGAHPDDRRLSWRFRRTRRDRSSCVSVARGVRLRFPPRSPPRPGAGAMAR